MKRRRLDESRRYLEVGWTGAECRKNAKAIATRKLQAAMAFVVLWGE